MLDSEDLESIDMYEILTLHLLKREGGLRKLSEAGQVGIDKARAALTRSNKVSDDFYQELQEGVKKC